LAKPKVLGEPRGAPSGVPQSARFAFCSIASFTFGAVDHVTIPFLRSAKRQALQVENAGAVPLQWQKVFRL
jgi:hypothetical protein